MKKITILSSLFLAGWLYACSDKFLEVKPKGVLGADSFQNKVGVNNLLTGAYSLLDGVGAGVNNSYTASNNWIYGSVAADEAYKGSEGTDQPDITFVETQATLPNNPVIRAKWRAVYDGVARCNDVLQALANTSKEEINAADSIAFAAQARFLRGHYHFEARRMWKKVPYIDEKMYNPNDPNSTKVPNSREIWPDIIADLKYAYDNLPVNQAQKGRVTKWAAAAMLAKAYLFQEPTEDYAKAKELLEAITASGKYKLMDLYHDNFRAQTNNNVESIFEIQFSVNDGAAGGENGNAGNILNYPWGGQTTCCGFFQPSQNLVNAFKTDDKGLPMLDNFNDADVNNDQGLASTQPFTPYVGNLDPRLDWTVGRRDIPYLDWGLHPGKTWVRDQDFGGPYGPKKHVFYKSDIGKFTSTSDRRANANNYRLIRYSHVLLWLAETEIEIGDLEKAREYVNRIRRRAANPNGFVKNPNGTAAATYMVQEYTEPWSDKEMARKAVRFEHRLEFAMEGHRRFDLVRWGIADQVLAAYYAVEKMKRSYLSTAKFLKGTNEYFPIPEMEIMNSILDGKETLVQTEGY